MIRTLSALSTLGAVAWASIAIAQPVDDDTAALRRAAEAAAETADPVATVAPDDSATPQPVALNRYNPEISASVDMLGQYRVQDPHVDADSRSGLTFRELEVDIRSALDPFSQFRAQLSAGAEGVGVEEAYVLWVGLAPHLSLTVGRMRQSLSPLNRWHTHALDQADQPLAVRAMIGDEGLLQTGLRTEVLLSSVGRVTHTLDLEVTNSENEALFAGADYARPATLIRLGTNVPTGEAGYAELGLGALHGYADVALGATEDSPAVTEGARPTDLVWVDLTWGYDPPGGADRFRLFARGQGLYLDRDLGDRHSKRLGGYGYLNAHLTARWEIGLRGDWLSGEAESVKDAVDEQTVEITPYLTFWQSEFVRLRLQYRRQMPDAGDASDLVLVQLSGAVGPHSHDKY